MVLDSRRRPPDLTEILPGLWVGEYPRVEDVEWLRGAFPVTAVLSLQDEDDLAIKGIRLEDLESAYRRHGIEFRRVPIADNDPESLQTALPAALDTLSALLDAGHRVLLHCNAGYNRAPTIAIAHLHRDRALPLEEASELVKAKRPCVPFLTVLRRAFRRG